MITDHFDDGGYTGGNMDRPALRRLEFNSLDAQREAAEAYILSQKHDGWTLVPTQYSDGGYTGANIERPGVRPPAPLLSTDTVLPA